jgi:hypothetical protein
MAELATALLEGALPLRTRLAARLHLWLCEACRHYIDQMRRTMRFLGAIPPRETPDNENEIMAVLEALRRGRGTRQDGE